MLRAWVNFKDSHVRYIHEEKTETVLLSHVRPQGLFGTASGAISSRQL